MIGAQITVNAGSIAAQFQQIRADIRRRVIGNIARLQGKSMVAFAGMNLALKGHVQSGALRESLGARSSLRGFQGGYMVTVEPRSDFTKTWANQSVSFFTRSNRGAERARKRGAASIIRGLGRVKHPLQYAAWIETGVRRMRRSKWRNGKKEVREFTQTLRGGPGHFLRDVFAKSENQQELQSIFALNIQASIAKHMKQPKGK